LLVRIRRWLAEQPSPAALSTAAQKKELTQLLDDSE